jgi:hypothetical protein
VAAAQQAFHVLDRPLRRAFHEGEIETADVRMRFRERVEHAVAASTCVSPSRRTASAS